MGSPCLGMILSQQRLVGSIVRLDGLLAALLLHHHGLRGRLLVLPLQGALVAFGNIPHDCNGVTTGTASPSTYHQPQAAGLGDPLLDSPALCACCKAWNIGCQVCAIQCWPMPGSKIFQAWLPPAASYRLPCLWWANLRGCRLRPMLLCQRSRIATAACGHPLCSTRPGMEAHAGGRTAMQGGFAPALTCSLALAMRSPNSACCRRRCSC